MNDSARKKEWPIYGPISHICSCTLKLKKNKAVQIGERPVQELQGDVWQTPLPRIHLDSILSTWFS